MGITALANQMHSTKSTVATPSIRGIAANNNSLTQSAGKIPFADNQDKNNGGVIGGVGYLGEKLAVGFVSSVEGLFDYTGAGLAKLFGADDWAEDVMKNDWFGDWYSHPEEWYNPSKGWQTAGDVAGGIGTSLPAILAATGAVALAAGTGGAAAPVSAGLLKVAGGSAAALVSTLGAAGNATKQAYRETGELGAKEFGYGALSGISEGAMEGVTNALSLGGGTVIKNISKSFAKQTAKSIGRNTVLKNIAGGFVGEAFEEGVQEFIDPYWQRMTYNKDAKNASAQEIAYAAFVGGMSGMLMSGGDVAVRATNSLVKGNNLAGRGLAGEVMGLSEKISAFESENNTGDETFQNVKSIYGDLRASLSATDGKIVTATQKRLLGELHRENTVAVFKPMIIKSAADIVNSADVIAEKLNEYGYKTKDGKAVTFTAEQIREGIDTKDPNSFAEALKTNDVLRTLAVANATGQLVMDNTRFMEATLKGKQLASQTDLDNFLRTAKPEEIAAVSRELNIENWETLDAEMFNEKIGEFIENGGVERYAERRRAIRDIQAIPAASARPMPQFFRSTKDGTVRYTDGLADIAVTKNGDAYTIYDYTTGIQTQEMSRAELNKRLKEHKERKASIDAATRAEADTVAEISRGVEAADAFARENIEDYAKLSAPNQSMIRKLIREGRAMGISDEELLTFARISARSGLDIVFSKEKSFVKQDGTYADGAIDLKNNRIIINPEAKSRTGEAILIHELTHAIYVKDGVLTVAKGLELMTDAEKEKIRKRYAKIGQTSAIVLMDEINAHFAEHTLSNKNVLERLVAEKPTLKDKILGFFSTATKDYGTDKKLIKASERLFKQYKKLFDEFSDRNFQNNASTLDGIKIPVTSMNDENMHVTGDNVPTRRKDRIEKASWYNIKGLTVQDKADGIAVANFINEVNQMIDRSKRSKRKLKIGMVSKQHEAIVDSLMSTIKEDFSAAGYELWIDGTFAEHIEFRHGKNGKADSSMASDEDKMLIPWAAQNAEKIEFLRDKNGKIKSSNRFFNSDGTGAPEIRLEKSTSDGVVYVSECVPDSKNKKIWITSAYTNKNGSKGQLLNMDSIESPQPTSKTSFDGNATNKSISKFLKKSNTFDETSLENSKRKQYALPETDSKGAALTQEQREYFANSKQFDSNGRLQVMYQGAAEEFYTFDKKKSKGSNLYGRGFYFTNSAAQAMHYGNVRGYYLNITNPVSSTEKTITRMQMRKFLNAVAENEDYSIENYGTYDVAEILRNVYEGEGKTDFAMLYDVSLTAIGDLVETVELFNEVNGTQYDGFILNTESVTFRSEQAKLVTNKAPTADPDMRFALSPEEDVTKQLIEEIEEMNRESAARGNGEEQLNVDAVLYRGAPRKNKSITVPVGALKKTIANHTHYKVYSKKTALQIIDKLSGTGELTNKTKLELADALWQGLNDCTDAQSRQIFAQDMAQYVVARVVSESEVTAPDLAEQAETLDALRVYIGSLSFSPDQLAEIKYIADKDGYRKLLGRWGFKGRDGARRVPMDVFVCDIAREMPGMAELEEMHPVDAFIRINEMYEDAKAAVKNKWVSTYEDAPDFVIKGMVQDVQNEILRAYESEGELSKFTKHVSERIDHYSQRAEKWKQEHDKIKGRDRLLGSLVDKAQKMKDLKLGTFANATQLESDAFRSSIEKLSRVQFRSNFNVSGTRKIIGDLYTWYTSESVKTNLLEYESASQPGKYVEGIAELLEVLSTGDKNFSKEELRALDDVMAYFIHFVENWGKVFRHGKWVEALPEAERYVDILHKNAEIKTGIANKLVGTAYAQTFFDNHTVARRMDMYVKDGFYTEIMEELRDAAMDAQVAEMRAFKEYDEFNRKNKNYVKNAAAEKISCFGTELTRMQLISVYMTLKRRHAQSGLAVNGFAFDTTDGKRVRVKGFADPKVQYSDEELELLVQNQLKELEGMFTEADKEYIGILERGYNDHLRGLKAERDMQRLGFTNATSDYYYPIRRGNIAHSVDTSDVAGEIDRVSNASFNKDVVKGAKQELYIESADSLFRRHVHAVCQYAHLLPVVESYDCLYNMDISGNKNKPISVATESANVWPAGNKFFKKLFADVQGISSAPEEGKKALGYIRGAYAKYQLGANPKVWFTQISSIFASYSMLDGDCIARGMTISAKDVDQYCSLAELRNYDNSAAMAQAVLDTNVKRAMNGIERFSDMLMAPIGKMDRFVVCRVFGACQAQVEKNGGAKVGTEENKIEAGKLLKKVILETQQNSLATERSAAMRSGNEIYRTLTMFTSDSMKVIGRVIDAVGEVYTLNARIKAETDAKVIEALKEQRKTAVRNTRKSVGALCLTAAFMAGIAQLFRWLYDKEPKDDETVAETVLVDAVGNLFGGLPLVKDVYGRIFEGYGFDNYAYSAVNDLLDSAINTFSVAGDLFSGEGTEQERNRAIRNLSYSAGQLLGLPFRNVYNTMFGLTKRFSPETAYVIDNAFYEKNLQNDFKKAIEEDDAEMAAFIMGLILEERISDEVTQDVFSELMRLSGAGQNILPRVIGSSITVKGESHAITATEENAIKTIYAESQAALGKLFKTARYSKLTDEQKAAAIDSIYDTYYDMALEQTFSFESGKDIMISKRVGAENTALLKVLTKGIESDVDKNGKTISGSKRKKVIAAIDSLSIRREQKLLLICYKGYSIQDNDIPGVSAVNAKKLLLRYILGLSGITQAEKAKLAEICGFEVKNGRILTTGLYKR